MRRRITTALLVTTLASTLMAAPAGAQLAGMATIEPEVVDAGSEPRQELRYRFTEGQTGTMAMDMTMDIATTTDGLPADGVEGSLSIRAELDTVVTDVYEDGSARVEQAFTSYAFGDSGDELANAELQAISDQIEGITVWQVIDDRGAVLEVGADAFDELPAEMQQQVMDSTVSMQPFPDEAVGVGARWVSAGSMNSQGLPISMSVETEILELTDEGVVLTMIIYADTDGAAALLEDMPPDVEANIDRFVMDGGGTIAVAFDELIPTSQAELDMEMAMSLAAGEGGEAFSYSMAIDMLMGMEVYPVE